SFAPPFNVQTIDIGRGPDAGTSSNDTPLARPFSAVSNTSVSSDGGTQSRGSGLNSPLRTAAEKASKLAYFFRCAVARPRVPVMVSTAARAYRSAVGRSGSDSQYFFHASSNPTAVPKFACH